MIKPNRSNRSLILGLIVAGGAVTLSVNAYQQPAAAAPKTLEVDKVKDNLFILKDLPPSGGNTAVFMTDEGVTIVDTKNPGWGQTILDSIKTITPTSRSCGSSTRTPTATM